MGAQGIFSSKTKVKVVVIGLDNAGKSTILQQLNEEHKGTLQEITPTVGFTTERFEHGDCEFEAIDMSGTALIQQRTELIWCSPGQSRYRTLWEHYYEDASGIIFVVDSTDDFRMKVVSDEIGLMLSHAGTSSRPSAGLIEALQAPIRSLCCSLPTKQTCRMRCRRLMSSKR